MSNAAVYISRLLVAFSILMALQPRSSAHVVKVDVDPQVALEPNSNITLTGMLAEVQVMLQDMKSKPVCEQTAHSTLIEACGTYDSTMEGDLPSSDQAVEAFRSVFAIQLTACEMERAKQPMPYTCLPLLKPQLHDPRHDITDCLQSLFSEGSNHWTSYESNKKAGLTMCMAMRTAMQKEELLESMSKIFDAVFGMGNAINMQGDELREFAKAFKDLGRDMTRFQEDFLDEHRQMRAEIQTSFTQMSQNMTTMHQDVHSLFESINKTSEYFGKHAAHLNDFLDQVGSLRQDVEVWNGGAQKLYEGVEAATQTWQLEHQQWLDKVYKQMFDLTHSVTYANEIVSNLAGNIELFNSDLDGPRAKIQGLNSDAGEAQAKMEMLQGQFKEMQATTNQTLDSLQEVHENVKSLAWIGAHIEAMAEWFTGSLLPVFLTYALAAGLVMLAIRRMGLDIISSTIVAAILGLPLSWCMRASFELTFKPTEAMAFEDEVQLSWRMILALGSFAGLLTGIVGTTLFNKLRARRYAPYDPASPAFQPQYYI